MSSLNFMGRVIPSEARVNAFNHANEQYERDKPYEAQEISLQYVDLTGHYRLMAAISAGWWEFVGQYECTDS